MEEKKKPLIIPATQKAERDQEDCSSRPDKKLAKPHLNQQARCGGSYLWYSYLGGIDRRIAV
jgi:hypothetical protein